MVKEDNLLRLYEKDMFRMDIGKKIMYFIFYWINVIWDIYIYIYEVLCIISLKKSFIYNIYNVV